MSWLPSPLALGSPVACWPAQPLPPPLVASVPPCP